MHKIWLWLVWALVVGMAVTTWTRAHAEESCSFEHGGDLGACDVLARTYPHAAEHPGVFLSGGVMALRRARCVHPAAVFSFHGAYYLGTDGSRQPSPMGSEHLRAALRRYPRLVHYLDNAGVWASAGGPTLDLTGVQLHSFGVPLCGE
jgi:hypothetical protein